MGQNWRGGASKSDALPTAARAGGMFVYLVARHHRGPTKVGVSVNVRKRVKSLETSIGQRFACAWVSKECTNAIEIERIILTKMRRHRTIGEWLAVRFSDAVVVAEGECYMAADYDAVLDRLHLASAKIRPINKPEYPRT